MSEPREIVRIKDVDLMQGIEDVADRMQLSDTDAARLVLRAGLNAVEQTVCGVDSMLARLCAERERWRPARVVEGPQLGLFDGQPTGPHGGKA